LGVEINYQSDKFVVMTQSKYIRDLLYKTKMTEAQPVSFPMVSSCKVSKTGSNLFSDPILYRYVVGALQYATLARLDISYAVKKVCQCMSNPLDVHWTIVKRILRYLKGTISYGLHTQTTSATQSFSITAMCDDWAFASMTEGPLLDLQFSWDLISFPGGPQAVCHCPIQYCS